MSKSHSTNTAVEASTGLQSNPKSIELEKPVSPNATATTTTDTQVKASKKYKPRRSYPAAYKQRILAEYDACSNAKERGQLLRKEGLYQSRIIAWKQQAKAANSNSTKYKKQRTEHLVRENLQLKKQLAQAEAVISLQKKVSELLGTHILPIESNEAD